MFHAGLTATHGNPTLCLQSEASQQTFSPPPMDVLQSLRRWILKNDDCFPSRTDRQTDSEKAQRRPPRILAVAQGLIQACAMIRVGQLFGPKLACHNKARGRRCGLLAPGLSNRYASCAVAGGPVVGSGAWICVNQFVRQTDGVTALSEMFNSCFNYCTFVDADSAAGGLKSPTIYFL